MNELGYSIHQIWKMKIRSEQHACLPYLNFSLKTLNHLFLDGTFLLPFSVFDEKTGEKSYGTGNECSIF
jgi:hypothetical protein